MATLDYTQVDTTNQPDPSLADEAVELAATLLAQANAEMRPAERAQMAKIGGMMDDPDGKALTMQMSDQAFRSHQSARVADQIHHLLAQYGVPNYFAAWERAALWLGDKVAQIAPQFVVPFIVAKLRQETNNVLLPGEPEPFRRYLEKRRADGTRLNINHLGEAVLGEAEAGRRFDAYLDLLARPDVEYISVKISSVFSQINLVAYEQTVEAIKERLRRLYHQAMMYTYERPDGTRVPKFVNLDMEEYRDLHPTVAAFQEVLSEDEFHKLRAGIVLQAYLPDSFRVQQALTAWAQARVEDGGAPIKLRIVKGANLAMEQVEASIHGWEQAPYTSKAGVDANYKRMVTYGSTPERAKAVNLGIASHNLFDVSYAMLLRERNGIVPQHPILFGLDLFALTPIFDVDWKEQL
ncbi:MAG: proline dehydrogenase family protein [Chloroflexota bacterium]